MHFWIYWEFEGDEEGEKKPISKSDIPPMAAVAVPDELGGVGLQESIDRRRVVEEDLEDSRPWRLGWGL